MGVVHFTAKRKCISDITSFTAQWFFAVIPLPINASACALTFLWQIFVMDAPGKKYVTKCPGAPRHTYMHAYIHAYIHTYIHAQPHIHTRMRTYTSNLARWLPQTFPCASRCWSPFRRPPKRRPPCFSFLFHQAARIFGLARRNETKFSIFILSRETKKHTYAATA